MLRISKAFFGLQTRSFGSSAMASFRLTDSGNLCLNNMPENMEEMNNSQRSVANMDRSRENSGQQTARQFSGQFMSDQSQQIHNQDMGSVELTHGYDMDGHANMASALQTNLPEPFKAEEIEKLKEGLPEGLSDVVRERGQRWAMEDRLTTNIGKD